MEDQGWYECRVLFLDQHSPEQDFANGSWVHLTVNCMKLGKVAMWEENEGTLGEKGVSEFCACPTHPGIRSPCLLIYSLPLTSALPHTLSSSDKIQSAHRL